MFTVSRYDSETQEWHWVGAEATSDRRSVATLLGNDNENGSGSYTRIHGWVYFDPTNQMHMTANVIEGSNSFETSPHYATHSLYVRADALGDNATHADGTPIELPGNAESGHAQQADIAFHDASSSLATFASVATDHALNPFVLLKKQHRDASGNNTGDEMLLVGWSEGGWVDFGDLDGALATGDNSRIYADVLGVMSVPIGTGLVRFFDPAEQVHQANVGISLDNVDRTYVQATGNFQALRSNGSEVQLVRVHITRPEGD